MATGFPVKANYATGDVLTAANMNDLSGTLNYLNNVPYNKNLAYNGNFDIWQRGTSFTSSGYTADRWYAAISGTTTVARESSIVPDGSTYCLKWTTGASTSYAEIAQAFEAADVNAMGGKTITASFKVRAQASFLSNVRLRLQTNTTADTQTGGTWTTVVTTDLTPSTSQFDTITASYTVPVGTKGLRILLTVAAAQASGTGLYLGQAQLEVGSVATPFSRAGNTIQGELAACQRYYQRMSATANGNSFANGFAESTTIAVTHIPFKVTMRSAPSALEQSGTASDYKIAHQATTTTCSAVPVFANATVFAADVSFTVASGLTAGNGLKAVALTGNAYLGWSAEL